MATVTLTSDNFTDTVTGEGITLVDWWAAWCGPCLQFGPIYDRASDAHPDITFAKIDTDAEQALSGAAGISSIPTLMAFRDGILVFQQAGALPGPELERVIAAIEGLDMDDVRAKVAEQQSAADAEKAQQQA